MNDRQPLQTDQVDGIETNDDGRPSAKTVSNSKGGRTSDEYDPPSRFQPLPPWWAKWLVLGILSVFAISMIELLF